MRSFTFAVALAWIALSGACAPTPPITVIHLGKTQPKDDLAGDPVKVRRTSDTYSGAHTGAYVVRSLGDWQWMWRSAADPPPFPQDLDPLKEMLFLVVNRDEIVSQLHLKRVIETSEQLTVFVRQTMMGDNCVRKPDEPAALDAVVTARVDKPVKFYIEDEDAPSCGEPPKAEIGCRLAAAQTWAPKLTAKAGDVVECELSSIARGKYVLIDQMLSLQDLPPGSNAKLAFSKGTTRATIALDTFGTYAIRAEATDEAGRKGRASALIDVLPKKTRDVLLQVSWTDVDTADANARMPRVLLRVAQEGPKAQRCSAEVPVPGLCDAKTRGAYTIMKIPASRRKLPVSLLYLDERPQAGPSPCVSVWFNGERTASLCDHDHRHAEDRWEIGTLETASGKMGAPKPSPELKAADPKAAAPARSSAPVASPGR
jgi:hypothetical protein